MKRQDGVLNINILLTIICYSIDERREFGHFKTDTIVGKHNGRGSVVLTLNERNSRCEFVRLVDRKDADSVNYALKEITNEYGDVIKTITAVNGTKFTNLNEILADVYYAHPYRSCNRATHNRIICHDIPNGMSLDTLSPDDVRQVEDHINHLPRCILDYQIPV